MVAPGSWRSVDKSEKEASRILKEVASAKALRPAYLDFFFSFFLQNRASDILGCWAMKSIRRLIGSKRVESGE
jgi:hypothetical protein